MDERRRDLTNDLGRLALLMVEPEGWDCWLLPGESVEMRAEVDSRQDDFDLGIIAEGWKVYPSSGIGTISLWQGDRELECGHQRPIGWP